MLHSQPSNVHPTKLTGQERLTQRRYGGDHRRRFEIKGVLCLVSSENMPFRGHRLLT